MSEPSPAYERYVTALRWVEWTQELLCEARYHSTTVQPVVKLAEGLHNRAKAEHTEALKALNETIIRGQP